MNMLVPYCSHSYYCTLNYEVTSDFKLSNVGKYKRYEAKVKMRITIELEVENHSFLTNSFLPPYYTAT